MHIRNVFIFLHIKSHFKITEYKKINLQILSLLPIYTISNSEKYEFEYVLTLLGS